MRQTKTTYACDACGTNVDRAKDLGHFAIEAGRDYRSRTITRTELCDECEGKFLGAVAPFVRDDATPQLMEARRHD